LCHRSGRTEEEETRLGPARGREAELPVLEPLGDNRYGMVLADDGRPEPPRQGVKFLPQIDRRHHFTNLVRLRLEQFPSQFFRAP
jgi:hypothetical protein